MIYLKIALRNLRKQPKQSLMMAFALFVCLLLFIGSNTIYSGLDQQIIKNYLNLQTGDVVLLWENTLQTSPSEVTRVYDSEPDTNNADANAAAASAAAAFLDTDPQVAGWDPVVMGRAKAVFADSLAVRMVYGFTPEDGRRLVSGGTLRSVAGRLDFSAANHVAVSESFALEHKLVPGGALTLNVTTPWGGANSQDYVIDAVVSSISAWDDYCVFMRQDDARALLDMADGGFQFAKVWLKDGSQRQAFRDRLNAALGAFGKTPLHAETYDEACSFILNFAGNNRMFFDSFNIFLLLIIALGISSTIRMNLFNRMPEIGTMRALGYSRHAVFFICFSEIACVTLGALLLVLAALGAVMVATATGGIRIPNPFVAMALGSDHFYLVFGADLALKTLLLCLGLVLLTVGRASQHLGAQRITSILAQNPSPVSLTGRLKE